MNRIAGQTIARASAIDAPRETVRPRMTASATRRTGAQRQRVRRKQIDAVTAPTNAVRAS